MAKCPGPSIRLQAWPLGSSPVYALSRWISWGESLSFNSGGARTSHPGSVLPPQVCLAPASPRSAMAKWQTVSPHGPGCIARTDGRRAPFRRDHLQPQVRSGAAEPLGESVPVTAVDAVRTQPAFLNAGLVEEPPPTPRRTPVCEMPPLRPGYYLQLLWFFVVFFGGAETEAHSQQLKTWGYLLHSTGVSLSVESERQEVRCVREGLAS